MAKLDVNNGDFSSRPKEFLLLPFIIFFAVFEFYLLLTRPRDASRPRSKLPLPPGPPDTSFLKALYEGPLHFEWLLHYQWRQTYGPVIHYKVAGRSVIVLTTVEASHELLNKRASNYSGRSFSYMAGNLVSVGYNMLFRQYDARFRLHQRLHVHNMNLASAALYHSIQELESLQLLHDIPNERGEKISSQDIREGKNSARSDTQQSQYPHWHFQRASASTLSVLAWGYRLLKDNPDHQAEMEFLGSCPTAAVIKTLPSWIDIFTWLRYVPHIISPWKRAAKCLYEIEASHHLSNFHNALRQPGYNMSKEIRSSVERLSTGMSETEMAWVVGTLTLANGETSASVLCWFVVAMLTYPGVMHKAHDMLDDVVGRERLPVYADRRQLPYIDAIIEEVLRWRPILPSGMDHAAVEEDEYRGYKIPKGATVVASQWAVTRDKEVFGADADDFRPERWLEGENLPTLAFGYGRRLCPGRYVGREGLWIMFARLLWSFQMETPTDSVTLKKKVVDPMNMPPMGFVLGPAPFQAVLRPRGEWVEEVVEKEYESTEKDVGKIMEKIEHAKGL